MSLLDKLLAIREKKAPDIEALKTKTVPASLPSHVLADDAKFITHYVHEYHAKRVREDGRYKGAPESHNLHVSDLLQGFCPRHYVLFKQGHSSFRDQMKISLPMRLVFERGIACEAFIKNSLLELRRSSLYGGWKCACGMTKRVGYYERTVCRFCRKEASQYQELPLEVDGVIGRPDILVKGHGKNLIVHEVKSANNEVFQKLQQPKADHVIQAAYYQALLAAKGFQVDDRVRIVYICPDLKPSGVHKTPILEFYVKPEPFIVELVQTTLLQVKRARLGIENGAPLPKRLCDTANDPRAKTCPSCSECFIRSN